MGSNHSSERLLVARVKETALVQVHGRGSFKVSPALKDFEQSIAQHHCRRLIVDMAACIGMDSTFMGVMAGIAMRLKKSVAGEVILVNLSDKNNDLLTTLGLDQVLRTYATEAVPAELREALEGPAALDSLETEGLDRQKTSETMLEAHENLVAVSPANRNEFRDVIEYLKEELNRTEGGESET